jgi:hypothetical protein
VATLVAFLGVLLSLGAAHGATFSENWTPAAGSTHIAPTTNCNTAKGGAGINLPESSDNVTIVNPRVYANVQEGCLRGIYVDGADNLKVVFDPNKAGYANSLLRGARGGIRIDPGSNNISIRGINGGEGKIRDSYRPVEYEYARDLIIENLDIRHPATWSWGTGEGSIVGIKALGKYTQLPADDKSFRNMTIRSNDVYDFHEEGISFDPATGRSEDMFTRGSGTVKAVSAANNTLDLGPGTSWTGNITQLTNAYLSFNSGPAAGKYLKIVGTNNAAKRVTLADPNNVLGSVRVGDSITAGGLFLGVRVEGNYANSTTCKVHFAFGGSVPKGTMRNNVGEGRCGNLFMPAGSPRPQSIRIAGWVGKSGPLAPGNNGIVTDPFSSVTGNHVYGAITFQFAGNQGVIVPFYEANNVSTNGKVYVDENYKRLASDPNP